MKHTLTIFICLLIVAASGCKKNRTDQDIPANELHYKELKCHNPWDRMTTQLLPESDTVTIKNWLQENGITPLKVRITVDRSKASCDACTCPTGTTIRVLFNSTDTTKAKTLGFYKP